MSFSHPLFFRHPYFPLSCFVCCEQKYNLYIDSMPTDGIPPLPKFHEDHMLSLAPPPRGIARSSQMKVLEEVRLWLRILLERDRGVCICWYNIC